MAGQIAALVKKEQSCKEIITEIFQEAYDLLGLNNESVRN